MTSALGFKPGWIPFLVCFIACVHDGFLRSTFYCETCFPLGSQPLFSPTFNRAGTGTYVLIWHPHTNNKQPKMFSISCFFWKFWQIVCCPLPPPRRVGAPSYQESWIRPWLSWSSIPRTGQVLCRIDPFNVVPYLSALSYCVMRMKYWCTNAVYGSI